MLRLRGTLGAVGLSLGWLAASAMAAPPVLDRVPDNAMVVIAIPNAQEMQKHVQSLVTAAELPIPAVPEVQDILAMGGVTKGLDLSKSAAMVVFAPDKEKAAAKKAAAAAKAKAKAEAEKDKADNGQDADKHDADKPGDGMDIDIDVDDAVDVDIEDQQIVVLLPVTSYADLLSNFGTAKPGAAGSVDQVTMPDGNDGFLKDVGEGYAAISPNKDLLTKFEAKSGASALKGKLGKAGDALADASDVAVVVNMDVVRPMWPDIKKEMEDKFKEKAEELPMGGEVPDPMANPAIQWLAESFMNDSRAIVSGIKAGNTGISLDCAVNFTEGTRMAKVFASGGRAGELLSKLPATTYLLAGAFDSSSAEVKSFLREFAGKSADFAKVLGPQHDIKQIDATEGTAAVVGVPQGGLFGGLLTSAISYTATKDPTAYVASQKAAFAELQGKQENGVSVATTYQDSSAKVDGADVDEYSVRLTVDPNSDAGEAAPQAINAIFGPTGGPAGYIAKADGGVYQTYGRNSDLLSAAMKAGKGADGLSKDQMLTQVAAVLPEDRLAVGYVGTKGLLDLIVPAAAMFTGIQIPADLIPEKLPPVGVAVSGRDGAAHASLFLPAPVIKTATKIGLTLQQQMEGAFGEGEGGDKPAPHEGDKGGTGQPRF